MKTFYIKDLKPDDSKKVDDRFVVRNVDIKDGNNGKKHLYMTLSDATGDIQAIKWSLSPEDIERFSKIRTGMVISFLCRESCNQSSRQTAFISYTSQYTAKC